MPLSSSMVSPSLLPHSPTVLSFRGPLGCGKTTAATYFTTLYNNVVKISFADALKVEVFNAVWYGKLPTEVDAAGLWIDMFPAPYSDFPGIRLSDLSSKDKLAWVNNPANKRDLRELLQYWGTEYRRAQDENYWVNQWVGAARMALNDGITVVVDDARFPNERKAINELGGYEIYLDSTEDFQLVRDGQSSKGIVGHESEKYNDPNDPDIDFIVRNSRGLGKLYEKLELIVRKFIPTEFNPHRSGDHKKGLILA